MIFVETIRTPGFVKTWFFLWKITNFSMNFRWKWTILQHFLLHLYTGNNKNDYFESKNINFEQKIRWFSFFFMIVYIWRFVKTFIFLWENDYFCIKNDHFFNENTCFLCIFTGIYIRRTMKTTIFHVKIHEFWC